MMLYALMPPRLLKNSVDDEVIELDDYETGCVAVYKAKNPQRKKIIYYQTDEGKGKNPEGRCDYLLLNNSDEISRYIELKGAPIKHDGEKLNAWDKGFEQLLKTYMAYGSYFNDAPAKVLFRMVTSFTGTLPRLQGYDSYRRLKLLGYEVSVMQPRDIDTI